MAKIKLTKVPFKGTPEQEALLINKLEEIKNLPGALMPAMQTAQDIYGYLPIEVQKKIAETLGVSLEKVFGVADVLQSVHAESARRISDFGMLRHSVLR
jgi:NADH:ubiquinone oxidoreductase 24 kD subunit